MAYNLPPTVRRILTTHDENGKAIVWKDEEVKPFDIRSSGGADLSKDGSVKQSGGSAKFAHLFTTDTFPYDNADTRDLALEETGGKLSNEGGIVLRIVDIPPHSDSPFHRTQSLDFGIVMEGECVLVLDDKKEIHMKRGDVAIQRGTIHGWKNYSDSWARIYFSLMASKPLTINGKEFGDAGYDGKAAH